MLAFRRLRHNTWGKHAHAGGAGPGKHVHAGGAKGEASMSMQEGRGARQACPYRRGGADRGKHTHAGGFLNFN
eukprot:354181-Chlamydomonas_euryale.AAC.2